PGEIRGRLTDSQSARPIADGRIEISGRADFVRSGADGTFLLRGLEGRTYTVRIRSLGHVARVIAVDVSNGRTTLIDIALDPVVTELRGVAVNALRDTSMAHATVFDRKAIEASGRRDIGELLQATPGLVVTQAGGPGSATRLSIRGSGANEVLVLMDGVPLNSSLTGDADLSQLTLENVERVTVRTGAQSARYGGRALAGVIEIQTTRGSRDASALLRTGAWGERNISASFGAGGLATDAHRTAGSLTGDYRTIRGDFPYERPVFRGGGTARRVNSGVTSRQLQGVLSFDHADDGIGLRGAWQDISRGLAGSISQPSATGRQNHTRLSGGIDARLQLRWLSWTAAGDITQERATYRDLTPPFGTAFDDTVQATGMAASTSLTIGRGATQASLGGEARTLDIESTLLAPGTPRRQRLLGAWGTVRGARLFESARLHVDAELSARIDENSLDEGDMFSPRAAVRVGRGAVVASATLGTGFAPPSLSDQFFHEGVLVRPNPALRPERTRGDLEVRLALLERPYGPILFMGNAAVYRADIDGMILWHPDFRYIWSPSNFDVHRSGWELNARGALPSAHLDVQGNVNRSDVSYAGPVLNGQVVYRP
ncbi:MAG: TonB-dependent receptor plug domain-containing protein, partial [Gemmatimonadaceae bacterium]